MTVLRCQRQSIFLFLTTTDFHLSSFPPIWKGHKQHRGPVVSRPSCSIQVVCVVSAPCVWVHCVWAHSVWVPSGPVGLIGTEKPNVRTCHLDRDSVVVTGSLHCWMCCVYCSRRSKKKIMLLHQGADKVILSNGVPSCSKMSQRFHFRMVSCVCFDMYK